MLGRLTLPWIAGSVGALLLGLLAGPIVAYWLGEKAAGEYADPGGLLVFWTSIYGDAFGFGIAGLVFLFGPLLMFQIGWAALRVWRKFVR
ncbi:MAG: hypothetical protein F4109_07990 [Gammaproteobacteria bacterium]|nr:hypothetical protein [Gammaproteobacteria bacterium]MYD02534.1 hypothetical protein [Gammaproteobacteria bacterium]MYI25351.1 hypothetical protein [Gammaproteobacteria bacterium]